MKIHLALAALGLLLLGAGGAATVAGLGRTSQFALTASGASPAATLAVATPPSAALNLPRFAPGPPPTAAPPPRKPKKKPSPATTAPPEDALVAPPIVLAPQAVNPSPPLPNVAAVPPRL